MPVCTFNVIQNCHIHELIHLFFCLFLARKKALKAASIEPSKQVNQSGNSAAESGGGIKHNHNRPSTTLKISSPSCRKDTSVCTDSRWCVITRIHIHISFPTTVIICQCTLCFFGRISLFIQQMWGQELLAIPCCCIHTWPIRPGLKHCGCSNCLSLCRPVCRLSSINKCPHVCKYSRG